MVHDDRCPYCGEKYEPGCYVCSVCIEAEELELEQEKLPAVDTTKEGWLQKLQRQLRDEKRKEFGQIGAHEDCTNYTRDECSGGYYCRGLDITHCMFSVCQFYKRKKA